MGSVTFDDYGLSWDETLQREVGFVNARYMLAGDEYLKTYTDRHYGPLFELYLLMPDVVRLAADRVGVSVEVHHVFFARHAMTFVLFFLSMMMLYRLGLLYFGRWKPALLAVFLVLLNPRIYAHAFYNSKDIPFLCITVFAMFALLRCLSDGRMRWFVMLAVCSAMLVSIRILGVFVPLIALGCGLHRLLQLWSGSGLRGAVLAWPKVLLFVVLFPLATWLFWPYLWEDPVTHFVEAYNHFKRFPFPGTVFFEGEVWASGTLPVRYVFSMIFLTCPLVHLVFFFGGFFLSVCLFVRRPFSGGAKEGRGLAVLAWVALPVLVVLILKPVLYDGWRHFYFVYPAMVLLMVEGLCFVGVWLKGRSLKFAYAWRVLLFVLGVHALSLLRVLYVMHPYQYVYFNGLAGSAMEAQQGYDYDYWGLSFRELLEHLVSVDSREEIAVFFSNDAGGYSLQMLEERHADRIKVVEEVGDAEYYLVNFRFDKEEPKGREVYAVERGGVKLGAIYKL